MIERLVPSLEGMIINKLSRVTEGGTLSDFMAQVKHHYLDLLHFTDDTEFKLNRTINAHARNYVRNRLSSSDLL